MDGQAGTRIAVAVADGDEIQASHAVYAGLDAGAPPEELRARLITATLELMAEGVSDPRLVETRHSLLAL